MQMDTGMDTGDILLQNSLNITEQDTAISLADKMSIQGGTLLIQAIELLRQDKLPPTPQNNNLATDAPMLTKDEARIDWQQPANLISCQIRGLDPWPKATTTLKGKWLRPFKPTVLDTEVTTKPGTITAVTKQGITVATGEGHLQFTEIQLEGKKRMAVNAFILGYQLKPGTVLGTS